ncbi:MAG: hypothetical protein ABS85_16030 [Sphingobacteriales bacterium SCN 48-20]|uniref:sulfite exporter TauE/SafE family protein n=1 Tax=Terrimonas ferruginea TaxID=249 RepID=UPI00086EBB82|nr:sulfite exporter TauE/SafE family protein [Terrimonas ferruginea]MBN8784898.1 sulfite exporter TauE/SafE family protein [Terrimonas ferruginea]ODT90174.1 MAG: hypothetical protein ABS85_16030 [Sphingobacteriales bacterium SCN 48-20]OJW43703.1 MAG: hypothetical protein BGO56_05215 [Sphingobacteriales bacterium 48-107]
MDNIFILLAIGFVIGTLGTLIGAGGGFVLVPLLLFTHPELSPETITAISIAIVAANAISGSVAYARSGRIDYRAGLLFALFTIPGSVLGVYTTRYIPAIVFHGLFGGLLIVLAVFLFFKKSTTASEGEQLRKGKGLRHHVLTDQEKVTYRYTYNQYAGIAVSVIVGYLSPLLGIGGGIIHVPALVHWLHFPVYVATATSHFILAIMASVSVIVHLVQGTYDAPAVVRMVVGLGAGVVIGAQLGAWLSHRIKGTSIVRALAICLALVGLRLLLGVLQGH